MVNKQYPDPKPPVRTSDGVAGPVSMVVEDDPEYLMEKERIELLRGERLNELSFLWALKDVVVPEGFDVADELGELIRLGDPDWQPRTGDVGRKLDYIEWVLLANYVDQRKVQGALAELQGIDLGASKSIEDSFRSDVEGETT
jgi:hypothetical protein